MTNNQVYAQEDAEELFPFESPEYSNFSAAPSLDSGGGRGVSLDLNHKFLSGTRLSANGGYNSAQKSPADSRSWSLGLSSNMQEDFSFAVHYEGWQRRTLQDPRCGRLRVACVEKPNQLRNTTVEGVRTSLNWSDTHAHFSISPLTQRIVLTSDLRAQELFGVGTRLAAGVFGVAGWHAGAWGGRTAYSRNLSEFADLYGAPDGQRTFDLYASEFGVDVGYTWNPWQISAAWTRSVMAVSTKANNFVALNVGWTANSAWSIHLQIGALNQVAVDTVWYITPSVNFSW
ncbi:MAG: hypothetical protein AABY83_05475 [Pseudomonadota bacterium]